MRKITIVAFVLAASSQAWAGGSPGSIGVGAEVHLDGNIGGVSVNYDAGAFHAGGVIGFSDDVGPEDTDIQVGGRFYYHLHDSSMSDFGVGAEAGIRNYDAGANDVTAVFLNAGFQIRAFVASNVAFSFTGGISIGTADAEGVTLGGDVSGSGGIHYYFF